MAGRSTRTKFENHRPSRRKDVGVPEGPAMVGPASSGWAPGQDPRDARHKVNAPYGPGASSTQQMDVTISRVNADIVGGDLTAKPAGSRPARPRYRRNATSPPKDLQKVGSEASKEIGDRFERRWRARSTQEQESVVDTSGDEVRRRLARASTSAGIEELQAENRAAWSTRWSARSRIIVTRSASSWRCVKNVPRSGSPASWTDHQGAGRSSPAT